MIKKHFWKIVLAVIVVLMGGSIVYAQYATSKANVGVVVQDHIEGPADAKVKLTEYGDFECPACGAMYPVVTNVLNKYGDKIQFEFKNFPLITIHPFAMQAAIAAESAGQQGKFFQMYDKLYQNQQEWTQSATPQVFFDKYAQEIGLNVSQFKEQMKSSVIQDHVKKQYDEATVQLGLTGTPTFFINGKKLAFQTVDDFNNAIEAALGIATSTASSTDSDASSSASAQSSVQFGI